MRLTLVSSSEIYLKIVFWLFEDKKNWFNTLKIWMYWIGILRFKTDKATSFCGVNYFKAVFRVFMIGVTKKLIFLKLKK